MMTPEPQSPAAQSPTRLEEARSPDASAGAGASASASALDPVALAVPDLVIVDPQEYLDSVDGVKREAGKSKEEEPTESLKKSEVKPAAPKKAPRITPNIKALSITASLFALITVVQVFAAQIANSQALLVDSVSMGVDSMTYVGNILVECRKRDGVEHLRSELIAGFLSLGCLFYFTLDVGVESWGTAKVCMGLEAPEVGAEEEDVNGWITLGFALGGIVFDLLSVYAFHRSHKKSADVTGMNMMSAFLHVGADLLRSTSTLVMSVLILAGGMDSSCLDSYTSLFIAFTILSGASFGAVSWLKLFATFVKEARASAKV